MPGKNLSSALLARLRERSIPKCFAEVVGQTPNAPALSSDGQAFTYELLDQASNKIAQAILSAAKSEDESVILMMGRNALAVVGMLAILKAGKICIPLHAINNEARMFASSLSGL